MWPQARLAAPRPESASAIPITIVTREPLTSPIMRTCWRNSRALSADGTVNAPLMSKPTDIRRTMSVPSGALRKSANAGAANQNTTNIATLDPITTVVAVGATSSKRPGQRTSVGSMPMSLMLAVSINATAPTV